MSPLPLPPLLVFDQPVPLPSFRSYICAFAMSTFAVFAHTTLYILLIFAHTTRLHFSYMCTYFWYLHTPSVCMFFVSYSFSRPPVPCEAISTFCLGGSVSSLANLQYHFVVIKILYSFFSFSTVVVSYVFVYVMCTPLLCILHHTVWVP